MNFICILCAFLIGIIDGYVIFNWLDARTTSWGSCGVDENTKQMKIHINPVDFAKGKPKKIKLDVVYGLHIPEEETRD